MRQETFDLASPEFLTNPAPMLAEMRAAGSLVPVKFPFVGRILVTTTHAATS